MNIAIVGGGIVGLALGYKLSRVNGNKVHVFEKEKEVGFHQSGRNSGVLHCGLAYKPGSCLLYTSPSPRDKRQSRMPSSA